jgi:hypothetical protein
MTGAAAVGSGETRSAEMDASFRAHIAAGQTKAEEFMPFAQKMVSTINFLHTDDPLWTEEGIEHREAALRSMKQATAVLERAVRDGATVPFLFFACIQDAHSAMLKFVATREKAPTREVGAFDGIQTPFPAGAAETASPATPSHPNEFDSTPAAQPTNSSHAADLRRSEEIKDLRLQLAEQYSRVVQFKMDRAARSLNVLYKKALEVRSFGGLRGRTADQSIRRIEQLHPVLVQFLETASQGADAEGLLEVINDIEELIIPIAAGLGVDYETV